MRKQTLISSLTTRYIFKEMALTRMPIFARRSRASTFQIICTIPEEWTHGYSCPRYFFLDTLRPRVIDVSVGGAAFGVGFGARSLLSCRKLHRSPCAQCLFLSTGDRYLFLLHRRLLPFDFFPRLQIQFSHVWRRSFAF